MSGLLVFPSLEEAASQGFEVCERLTDGYLVRRRFSHGWQMALVSSKPKPELREPDDSPYIHFDRSGDPAC